jgi:ectoine hydroxylase-related dioxygenase (phytanoyl-CoA dioxygenase family)
MITVTNQRFDYRGVRSNQALRYDRVVADAEVPSEASSDLGYRIVSGVLGTSETDALLAAIDGLDLDRGRAGARHLMRHAAVHDAAHDLRLMAIAREFLGASAVPYRATLFDKSSARNWLITWHQDTALPLDVRRDDVAGWGPWSIKSGIVYAHAPASALSRIIALRLHFDDSCHDNGPLRVLPGTQAHGVLTESAIDRFIREIAPVDCLVTRGGVIAMRPLLLHASSKATTDRPRRVLHIEYADSLDMPDGFRITQA